MGSVEQADKCEGYIFDRVSKEEKFKSCGNGYESWKFFLVNGTFTDPFKVTRSIRQGCSLSPLLYVLCMEPFAERIRRDKNINGFKLLGSKEEIKISLYADDTTLVLTGPQFGNPYRWVSYMASLQGRS